MTLRVNRRTLILVPLVLASLVVSANIHARLSGADWDRIERTTKLLIFGSFVSIEKDENSQGHFRIRVEKVISNTSSISDIQTGSVIDVFDHVTDTVDFNYLHNPEKVPPLYFFIGRYEGKWRFSDTDASFWYLEKGYVGNRLKTVLCQHLIPYDIPEELTEEARPPQRRCYRPPDNRMVTEEKLLNYFKNRK